MLFPYTYVPHSMEKMQSFIDFIFHEVWCKAPDLGPYGLNLFEGLPELHEVMTSFHYDDTKGAEFFSGHVERIYGLFAALTADQIEQFQHWYRGNNDLEKVCAKDPAAQLARYADIAVNHKELAGQLGSFCKGLYSQSLLDLAVLRSKIGDIDDHYEKFVEVNDTGKCPFCGINDLLGQYHSKREAYDHYLPKALYPFNSINFRNLVPACHHCNSSYKTSKDTAHTPKDPAGATQRRAAFYPYTTESHAIELQVSLKHADIPNLQTSDVSLQFGPAEISEEIATWKDVYGIEERYKAKLCTKSDGKAWLAQVVDEWKERGRSPEEFLEAVALGARKRPYTDYTFLKKPFLEACKEAGLFDAKLNAA